MSKIKKILALQDLPLRLLVQLDDQLRDILYQQDFGNIEDAEIFLTQKSFAIAFVKVDDFFFVIDCEDPRLEDFDLTDPKNSLDGADSFTIKDYQELFSGNFLIYAVREKITELLEVPIDLQTFGGVSFNG